MVTEEQTTHKGLEDIHFLFVQKIFTHFSRYGHSTSPQYLAMEIEKTQSADAKIFFTASWS